MLASGGPARRQPTRIESRASGSAGSEQLGESDKYATKKRCRLHDKPQVVTSEKLDLVAMSVTPATRRHYVAEVLEFEEWARQRRRRLHAHDAVDQVMLQYFTELAGQRDAPQIGRACLFGYLLLRLPSRAKDGVSLPLSRLALRGWTRLLPGRVRDPVPLEVAWWVATYFLEEWPHKAIGRLLGCAVVIQVDSYCRPGALMGIQAGDLYGPAPRAGRHYKWWSLVLAPSTRRGRTKARQQDESIRLGVTSSEWVTYAARFLKSHKSTGPVFAPLTLRSKKPQRGNH